MEGIQNEAIALESRTDEVGERIEGGFDQVKTQFEEKYGEEAPSFLKRGETAFRNEFSPGIKKYTKDNSKEFMSVGHRKSMWELHNKIKEENRLKKQAEKERTQGFSLWDHAVDRWKADRTRAKVMRQAMMNLFCRKSEEKEE